jgi:hypothetical protein
MYIRLSYNTKDRFLGVVEVPFDEFDLDSIPFHRIRQFRLGTEVVWDRKLRIDVVFSYRNTKKK